ncbi:MAG: uracil-DNA glycosylase [Clostridia bacterium]|nr:uracil-DNA glycosylase [Clostridia bacterium]
MVNIGNSWDELLKDEFKKDYYLKLREFLKSEYSSRVIYPDMYDIFNALKASSYEDIKVVILGQDPYHEPGQAHGMCFSVKPGVKVPPSLVNMYKELAAEYPGYDTNQNGYLQRWADQGVLLLNTVLTVRAHAANSHKGKGWEIFTDKVITLLDQREKPVVFLLWGANARSKAALIKNPNHYVLQAAHPSPLSAYNGFFGCGHFRRANEILEKTGQTPIVW